MTTLSASRRGAAKVAWAAALVLVALTVVSAVYVVTTRGKRDLAAPGATTQPAGKPLLIYVGTSMRQPMEQIIKAYEAKGGGLISPSYGDSGEVLAQVQHSGMGEAAVLHEPYLTEARQKGWSTSTHVIAYMTPVIAVAKGNPKNVTGLRDFARTDLRVGMTDARYTTSGQFVQEALKNAGIHKQVMDRDPYQNKSSGHMAMQVLTGALDAVTLWDAVAGQHPDNLDVVRIEPDILPARFTDNDGVTYTDAQVAVGLFTLKTAADPQATGKFVEFILSSKGQEIWQANGFKPVVGQ